MGFTIGHAAVAVFPSFDKFHYDIKKEVEEESKKHKVEVPVELQTKDFYAEMSALEKRIDKLDGREIDIYVNVHDETAQQKLNNLFSIGDRPIVMRTEIDRASMENTGKQIEDFQSANQKMDMFMDINRHHADAEMDDFKKKYDGTELLIRPVVDSRLLDDLDSRMKPKDMKVPDADRSRSGKKPLDIYNILPRFISKMNEEFEDGVRQMTNGYIRAIESVYRVSGLPIQNLKKMVYEANNLNELGQKINASFGNVFSRETLESIKNLKFMGKNIKWQALLLQRDFIDRWKALPPEIHRAASAVRSFGNWVSKVARFMNTPFRWWGRNLKEGATRFASYMKGATLGFIQSGSEWVRIAGLYAREVGETVGKNVKNSVLSGAGKLKEVGKNIIWAMFPQSLAGQIHGTLKSLGSAIGDSFDALKLGGLSKGFETLGKKAVGALSDIQNNGGPVMSALANNMLRARDRAHAFGRKFGAVGESIGRFGRRIGRFASDSTRRFGRTFSNMARSATRGMKSVGGALGRGMMSLGRVIGRSNMLFKGFRAIFGRVGNMAMGLTRHMAGAFFRLGGVMIKAIMPALGAILAGLLALGGQAVLGAIMALGGAIMSVASGAMAMVPALVAAAGISFAALKIGLAGVKTGIKSAFSAETVEEFEEAISKLPAGAQEVARAMRGFKPAMDEMKEGIQNNLLEGLAPKMSSAMENLLPVFSSGLQSIASHWNKSFSMALDELSSDRARKGMETIFSGVDDMSREMQPTISNLLAAFGSLAEQGAKFLGPLGRSLNSMSEGFLNWAEGLKQIDEKTGLSKFDVMIENAKRNAALLGDIFGGLFGTIGNVFRAGAEGGMGMLDGMARSLQNLKEYTSEGNAGFEKLVEFMGKATEAASMLGDLIAPAFDILMSVGSILADLAAGALPGLIEVVGALAGAFEPIKAIASDFGKSIGDAIGTLAPAFGKIGEVLAPVLEGLGQGIGQIIGSLGGENGPLSMIMESLKKTGEIVGPIFESLGGAVGKIFEALGPVVASLVDHVNILLPVFEPFIEFLGEAITKIVEMFGPILDQMKPTMQLFADAFMEMAEAIFPALMEVLEAIAPIIPIVADAFFAILDAVMPLLPVLGQLVGAILVGLADLLVTLTPMLPPLAGLIGHLAKVIGGFLVDAIQILLNIWNAVWPILLATFQFLFNVIIMPLLWLVVGAFHALGAAVDFVWNFLIKPVLDLFIAVAGFVFNAVAGLITGVVIPIFQNLGDFLKFIWEVVIRPVFQALRDFFSAVVDWIRDRIEQTLKPSLEGMKNAFKVAVDGIKSIWEGLKKIFAAPIRFLIETVINKGVIGPWNWVDDKLDGKLGKFDEVRLPPEMNFATGGVLPGYTPGRDVHSFISPTAGRLNLSGGEAIMRPEWTRAVGGPGAVEAMNRRAREGGVTGVREMLGEGAAYALGGVIGAVPVKVPTANFSLGGVVAKHVDKKILETQQEARKHHGKPYQWGGIGDPSYDCSGLWSAIVNHLNGGPFSGRLFTTHAFMGGAPPGWRRGLHGPVTVGVNDGHMAGTLGGINMESASMPKGVQIGGSAWGSEHPSFTHQFTLTDFMGEYIKGAMGSTFNPLRSMFNAFWDTIVSPIKAKFGDFGDKGVAKILPAAADKILDSAKNWLIDKLPASGGGADGAGAEQWRGMLVEAFKYQVEEPLEERVNALLRQIQTESSGNPAAVQQIVDRNGTGESAGVGLTQAIPTTWAAYRDRRLVDDRKDPWAHLNFAVRYFRDKHGWDTSFVGAGHGWASGGVLPDFLNFFDSGGEAKGTGYLPKNVIAPERVLSPSQTEGFNAFVFKFIPQMIENFKDFSGTPEQIRQAAHDIVYLLSLGNISLEKMRKEQIDNMTEALKGVFGKKGTGRSGALGGLLGNFGGAGTAAGMLGMAYLDPEGYLEAEEAAIAAAEEEEQEAERASSNSSYSTSSYEPAHDSGEVVESPEDGEPVDVNVVNLEEGSETASETPGHSGVATTQEAPESASAETVAVESSQQEEAAQAQVQAAEINKEAANSLSQADKDAQAKKEQEEQEEIRKKKETGEYYYGFKVLNKDGSNPNEYEPSEAEKMFRKTLVEASGPSGFQSLVSKIDEKFTVAQSLASGIMTAVPAWTSAISGVGTAIATGNFQNLPSAIAGLSHNIAAASASALAQTSKEAMELIPSAVTGIGEMLVSTTALNSQQAPFIENVNAGMTKSELMQTLSHYDMMRSRKGGGTPRMRG